MEKRKSLYDHELYMARCLELAAGGLGFVAPNPLVGAVVVWQDKVIGEGFHRRYGGPHAEVYAISSVQDQEKLKESILFVNLEPCAHQGKTPPCTDLIISKKIPRVVIGTSDINSLVAGKGIKKLRRAGIEVITDVLVDECYELNRRFFTFHKKKRPYIILKWAQTLDGFIDVEREPDTPVGVNWISTDLSRTLVHRWRSEEQGILAGTNTIILDNPSLTLRYWKGNDPVRIILDRNLRIPGDRNIWKGEIPTLIYNSKLDGKKNRTEYIRVGMEGNDLSPVLADLYSREIMSVIVEGGKSVLEYFIRETLWDEARVFVGKKKFERGLKAPVICQEPDSISHVSDDLLHVYRNRIK